MPDAVRIRFEHAGTTLEAYVDPASHRITFLAGTVKPVELQAALVLACVGHTVQDVSEHAVIRVESQVRGGGPRPVAGVVQPENAGPRYVALLPLVRGLLQDYMAKTGYRIAMNTEEGPLQASSEWGTSTVSERRQRIQNALPPVRVGDVDHADLVRVKEMAGPRVTLEIADAVPPDVQRRYLTQAEALLRRGIDAKLELFLADKKDMNVKRHANEEALGI